MPKSPTKTRPRTVANLMTSARELFIRHGYHATSISDICGHAGLTRGAFYSNYRGKEQLFLALYDVESDRILADLDAAASKLEDGVNPVQQILSYLAVHRRDDRQWFLVSMEFTLHAARNPDLAAELAPHENRLTAGIVELLTRLHPDCPADVARDLARLITAFHEGTTAHELIQADANADFRKRVLPPFIAAVAAAMDSAARER